MAEVFRAIAPARRGSGACSSIKRIRPDRTDSPKFVQMFCDEARISALLHHPNIVQIYDFGQIDGAYFMAMEYLDGKDLSAVMRALRARATARCRRRWRRSSRARSRAPSSTRTRRSCPTASRAASSTATSRRRTSCCSGRAA